MDKKFVAFGCIMGFICTTAGASMYLFLFTDYNFFADFAILKSEHILGKVIALGSTINLLVFLILIKLNREYIARGLVLSTLLIAVATIFV